MMNKYCDKCGEICVRLSSFSRLCCKCINIYNRDKFCQKCKDISQKEELGKYSSTKKIFFESKEEMIEYGIVPTNIIELYESISKLKPNTRLLGKNIRVKEGNYAYEFKNHPTIDFEFLSLKEHNNFMEIWRKKEVYDESGKLVNTLKITKQFNSPWEFFKYLNNYGDIEKNNNTSNNDEYILAPFMCKIGGILFIWFGLGNIANLIVKKGENLEYFSSLYSYTVLLCVGFLSMSLLIISYVLLENLYFNSLNESDKNV